MSYDLTAFLTTVAAASSSIVAILGGFIASKLITISGERDVVLDKIDSIEKELQFKKAERETRQRENDTDDALSFIRKHIGNVLYMKTINDVYDTAESQCIDKDKLQEYWNKALELSRELKESFSQKIELNSDSLPKDIAHKYAEDRFSYEVLTALMRHLKKLIKDDERRKQEERRKTDPLASIMLPSIDFSSITENIGSVKPFTSNWNYSQNEQEIAKLTSDISYLEFQKSQLEEQRKALAQPKGMRTGLVIFVLFALACIITPLAMSPRYTDDLWIFWKIKIIILFLFITGLIAIFGYLVYLLGWKENSKKNERIIISLIGIIYAFIMG